MDFEDLPKRGHGSIYEYHYAACRCEHCRAANAAYHRHLIARYQTEGPRGEHGTTYCYDTGCRCDKCREAKNRRSRESKRRQREAKRAEPNSD